MVSVRKKILAAILCVTMATSAIVANAATVTGTGGTESSVTSTVSALTNKSTISKTEIFFGDAVTLNAVAEGGTAPYKYAFSCRHESATGWTTLTSYGTTTKRVWQPKNYGKYKVCAKVKDADGTEVKKFFDLTVSKGVLTNKSTVNGELIDKQTVEITKGETIVLNGVASYGTEPYQYSFSCKHSTAAKWTTLTSYGSTTKRVWKPNNFGSYQVCAKVKDADGTEVKKFFELIVDDSLENKSSISSYVVSKGGTISMHAKADGGTAPYTYSYAVEQIEPDGGTKTVIKDFSTETTCDYTFNDEGKYEVYITVKDSNGVRKEKSFVVSVYTYYQDKNDTGLYRIVDDGKKTVSYLGTTGSKATSITVPDYVQLNVKGDTVDSYKVIGVENLGVTDITKVTEVRLPVTLDFIGDFTFENVGRNTRNGAEIYFDYNKYNTTELSQLTKIGENAFRGAFIKIISLGKNLVNIPANAFNGANVEELVLEDGFNTADGAIISTDLFKKTDNTSGATITKVVLKGDNVKVTDDWFTNSNTGDNASIVLDTGVTSYFYAQHNFEDEDFRNKFSIECGRILNNLDLIANGIAVSFVSASKDDSNIDYTGKTIVASDIKFNGYLKIAYSDGRIVYLPTELVNVTMTSSDKAIGAEVEFTASSSTYGLGSVSCKGTITKVAANSDNIVVLLTNAKKVRDDYYLIDVDYSVDYTKDEKGKVVIESIENALNNIKFTVKYRNRVTLSNTKYTIEKVNTDAHLVYNEDTKEFELTKTPTINITVANNDYCNASDGVAKTIKLGISIKLRTSKISINYVDEEGILNENVEVYNGIVEEDGDYYKSTLTLPSTSSPFSSAIKDISLSVYTYCKSKAKPTEVIKLVTLRPGVDYAVNCTTDLDTDGNGDVGVKFTHKTDFLNTDFTVKFKSLTVIAG